MGKPEGLHQERTGVLHRNSAACVQGNPAGTQLPSPGNSTAQHYKAATSSQHGIQVRHKMVEGIRGPLERGSCHGDT